MWQATSYETPKADDEMEDHKWSWLTKNEKISIFLREKLDRGDSCSRRGDSKTLFSIVKELSGKHENTDPPN